MTQQEHLERVQNLFSRWRAERKPRQRIPETLWSEAHELSKSLGISQTCQKLRLNQGAFKHYREKLEEATAPDSPDQSFLELPKSQILSRPFRAEISIGLVGGHRLSIRLEDSNEKSVALFLRHLMTDS